MKCPCLRETSVHSCSVSSVRKMIATQALGPGEKCITGAHRTCAAYTEPEGGSDSATCPFLLESVVQFCAAAGAPQYVPWSEHSFSRCGASGHRYCELYLQLAGVPHDIESRLRFTRNHFWFDVDEDGWWHAGIDSLLARALGKVDAIAFVPGESYPSVIVTADGTDWVLTLPHKVRVANCNSWLRADPGRLTRSPYSFGWLFEGQGSVPTGLIEGSAARAWLSSEADRASRVLHACLGDCPADGGTIADGVLGELGRERAIRFFLEMFSPLGGIH